MELKLTPNFLERSYLHGALLILCVGAGLLGFVLGKHYGKAEGKEQAQLAQKAQALDAVQTMLLTHTNLVAASQEASTALRTAAAQRQETDTKTTQELRDALIKTAGSRAGCRLDAASLQLVQAAAARAAVATTPARASGSTGAVPAATAAAGR